MNKRHAFEKIICVLLLIIFLCAITACKEKSNNQKSNNEVISKKEQTTGQTTNTLSYTSKEKEAIEKFEILYNEAKKDTSGTYSNIAYGTEAYSAIVSIEKLYKSNTNNKIITQIYYYAKVISCIRESSSTNDYYNWGVTYAKKIDQSYNGPYATEIKELAKKYTGNPSSSSVSSKNALNMSTSEKAKVKAYIKERYEYYDKISGGYSGDKYTSKIWQETANKFGISTTDVDMIWSEH